MIAMLIRSHTGASASPLEPLAHGGDLAAARQLFPDAPEPFIDLSTGINPHPYPVPELSSAARMPFASATSAFAVVSISTIFILLPHLIGQSTTVK